MPYQSIFRPDLLAHRTILVTGGGTGIGRCTAHELASLGAHVTLVGRRPGPLQMTAAEITDDDGSADWHTCDIRDSEQVTAVVAAVVERHGPVHGLVNNAGGQFSSPLADMSQKGFEAVVRTNLVGGFLMAREVYSHSMRHHGGAVVNITADHSRGIPLMGHSSAARAAMANLTRTLAVEWAAEGVRVNAVAPGFVASSGYDTYDGEPFHELLTRLPELTLARRHGTESEISAAIVFLLSNAAAYITGQELLVAGGADLITGLWEVPDHQRLRPYDGFHRSAPPAALDTPSAGESAH